MRIINKLNPPTILKVAVPHENINPIDKLETARIENKTKNTFLTVLPSRLTRYT